MLSADEETNSTSALSEWGVTHATSTRRTQMFHWGRKIHQTPSILRRHLSLARHSLPSRFPMPSSQQHPSNRSKVLVWGAGNFGSCLADHLGDSQHDVFMWSREADIVQYFNLHHRNPTFLKGHQFSDNIQAVGPEMPTTELLKDMDVLLFAIPTQGLR